MCGAKQSLQRIYATSQKAKDCRELVQQYNQARGEVEAQEEEAAAARDAAGMLGAPLAAARPVEAPGPAAQKWVAFEEEEDDCEWTVALPERPAAPAAGARGRGGGKRKRQAAQGAEYLDDEFGWGEQCVQHQPPLRSRGNAQAQLASSSMLRQQQQREAQPAGPAPRQALHPLQPAPQQQDQAPAMADQRWEHQQAGKVLRQSDAPARQQRQQQGPQQGGWGEHGIQGGAAGRQGSGSAQDAAPPPQGQWQPQGGGLQFVEPAEPPASAVAGKWGAYLGGDDEW